MLVLLLLFSFGVLGQTNVITGVIDDDEEGAAKRPSARAVLGVESNFSDAKNQRTRDTSLEVFVRYRFDKTYSAQLFIAADKSLEGAREGLARDSRLSLFGESYSFFEKKMNVSPFAAVVIPTSKLSREERRLHTALEINPNFNFPLSEYVSFSYNPRLRKNFNEFQIEQNGDWATSYSVLHFAFLTWAFADKFAVTPGFIYVNAWDYRGEAQEDSYLSLVDLGYQYDSKRSFNLGIRTRGTIVDNERGPDKNFEFYDAQSSVVYFSFSQTI